MTDLHARIHPNPAEAVLRAPLPPRRRAQDQIADAATVDAYDYNVDRGWGMSFSDVSQLCRIYHAQLVARGGRL